MPEALEPEGLKEWMVSVASKTASLLKTSREVPMMSAVLARATMMKRSVVTGAPKSNWIHVPAEVEKAAPAPRVAEAYSFMEPSKTLEAGKAALKGVAEDVMVGLGRTAAGAAAARRRAAALRMVRRRGIMGAERGDW